MRPCKHLAVSYYEVSYQHKDVSAAAQARYVGDTVDLISTISMKEIRSFRMTRCYIIANDMTAQERVNFQKAREIGVKIVESMAGKSADEFTFRKANQAVTLGSRSTVRSKVNM